MLDAQGRDDQRFANGAHKMVQREYKKISAPPE